ncbi:hypothetical protein TEA_024753 [Camellia sinensis var. sinensis]|uniref:HD-Zip IV C-terminal domain-containing protein n=1 Tax=Camellia sinensis var. sinensis TaxID=542762 RepID=A0A4S4ELI9_CAMSN|nr:hypothetical protein TEA_024753 [Camellia sinensis var. sinensis]
MEHNQLDIPHLSEVNNNSGFRVSFRKNTGLIGQSDGFIVTAATSLWLPLSSQALFGFFRDEKMRAQWDVLSNGNPSQEIASISYGNHPENRISILQFSFFFTAAASIGLAAIVISQLYLLVSHQLELRAWSLC